MAPNIDRDTRYDTSATSVSTAESGHRPHPLRHLHPKSHRGGRTSGRRRHDRPHDVRHARIADPAAAAVDDEPAVDRPRHRERRPAVLRRRRPAQRPVERHVRPIAVSRQRIEPERRLRASPPPLRRVAVPIGASITRDQLWPTATGVFGSVAGICANSALSSALRPPRRLPRSRSRRPARRAGAPVFPAARAASRVATVCESAPLLDAATESVDVEQIARVAIASLHERARDHEQRRDDRRRRVAGGHARRARHLDALVEAHAHRLADGRLDAEARPAAAARSPTTAATRETRTIDSARRARTRHRRDRAQNPYGSSAGVVRSGCVGVRAGWRGGTMRRNCPAKNVFTSSGRACSVALRARMTSSSVAMRDDVLHPA